MYTSYPPDQSYVFVYGTLRSGQTYHDLLGGRTPISLVKTPPYFELVSLGPYPAMMTQGHTAIVGEIYRVDESTMKTLDELEGHPDFYQRCPIDLPSVDLSGTVWTYVLPRDRFTRGARIESGDWVKWVDT